MHHPQGGPLATLRNPLCCTPSLGYPLQRSHCSTPPPSGHIHGRMASGTHDFPHDDDASIYSTATSSYPVPGRLSNVPPVELEHVSDLIGGVQGQSTSALQTSGSSLMDRRCFKNLMINPDSIHQQRSRPRNVAPLPTVVVSEEPEDATNAYDQGRGNVLASPINGSRPMAGRTPSSLPNRLNFSRPVLPAAQKTRNV